MVGEKKKKEIRIKLDIDKMIYKGILFLQYIMRYSISNIHDIISSVYPDIV